VRLAGPKKGAPSKMTDKDKEFVQGLIENTKNGRVKWQPTATPGQLTVSFKGKYNVSIESARGLYSLVMSDLSDNEIFTLSAQQDYTPNSEVLMRQQLLRELHEVATRTAFSVDSAMDEILSEFPPSQ